jgi:hypothetical protein
MVRCRWFVTLCVILVALTAVLIQGCGLKADPSPRRIQPLMGATDIRLHTETGGGVPCGSDRHHAAVRLDSRGPVIVSEQSEHMV